jgi:hypothetical protein
VLLVLFSRFGNRWWWCCSGFGAAGGGDLIYRRRVGVLVTGLLQDLVCVRFVSGLGAGSVSTDLLQFWCFGWLVILDLVCFFFGWVLMDLLQILVWVLVFHTEGDYDR